MKKVYYDKRIKGMFAVYYQTKHRVIITEPSEFHGDAMGNYVRYSITQKYFKGCCPIEKDSPLLETNDNTTSLISARTNIENLNFLYVDKNNNFRFLDKLTRQIVKTHDFPAKPYWR